MQRHSYCHTPNTAAAVTAAQQALQCHYKQLTAGGKQKPSHFSSKSSSFMMSQKSWGGTRGQPSLRYASASTPGVPIGTNAGAA